MSIEAMKKVVDLIESVSWFGVPELAKAVSIANQAIAEAERQEPVAMWDGMHQVEFGNLSAYKLDKHNWIPLYTSPPQRQPEQEPVAWGDVKTRPDGRRYCRAIAATDQSNLGYSPLYTSPPQRQWVGLTDEEVRQMCGSVPSMRDAVREAEAKLKEKNT